LAYHNGCPFSPVGIDKPGDEPLFREFIHKLADSLLDIYNVLPGDLSSQVALTHNCHPNALPSDPGVTKLPNLLGPLSLPTLGSAPRWPLSFAWAL
jgi:hypothetical protein